MEWGNFCQLAKLTKLFRIFRFSSCKPVVIKLFFKAQSSLHKNKIYSEIQYIKQMKTKFLCFNKRAVVWVCVWGAPCIHFQQQLRFSKELKHNQCFSPTSIFKMGCWNLGKLTALFKIEQLIMEKPRLYLRSPFLTADHFP